ELEKRIKVTFERVEIPSIEELKSSRIHNWANLIVNTKVDEQADGILGHISEKFAHLSKEDILKRLITTQLDHLTSGGKEDDNLNEAYGGSPDKRDRGAFNRYFVNIGSIDGMTKSDLVHFLSDAAEIDRKYFGDITMQKNRSYVDVDSSQDKAINLKFEGVEIDGRSIRMNKDDDGGPTTDFGRSKKKKFKSEKRRGDRPTSHRKGARRRR
ncbi:MAG: DbpA RNA binding domain-containing protein, partial [Marinoscillum sp.]